MREQQAYQESPSNGAARTLSTLSLVAFTHSLSLHTSVGPYAATPHRHTYDTRMIRRIIRMGKYACWRRAVPEGPRASRKWPPQMGPICAPIAHNGSRDTPKELESVQAELRAELEAEEGAEAHAGASTRPRTAACPAAAPSRPAQQAAAGSPPSHRSCSACNGRPWRRHGRPLHRACPSATPPRRPSSGSATHCCASAPPTRRPGASTSRQCLSLWYNVTMY